MTQLLQKQVLPSNGGAWAAVLAAGIGCVTFGLLVDLAEAFSRVSQWLSFYKPVGDLSGKSAIAVGVWLVVWCILHFRWKGRHRSPGGVIATIAIVLIIVSLIATFPPFFGMFAS
jgi:hypothetical protein